LSWTVDDPRRDAVQSAFKILVASDPKRLAEDEGDIWDSGEVATDQSCGTPFNGERLVSGRRYWWKVRVRDDGGTWGAWSADTWFEMGLMNENDWPARWIGAPRPSFPPTGVAPDPAPYFRKIVSVSKEPASVRAYVSGLGFYELHVNGEKCGAAVLAPAFSHYDRSVYYDTHDLSTVLRVGENVIGVILGTGWYAPSTEDTWDFHKSPWRHTPKLFLQLHIEYADGQREIITTDSSWKVKSGPIQYDGLRSGEHYDARLELDGWTFTGYDDSQWERVQITRPPGGVMKSSQMPPIKEIDELEAVSVSKVEAGVHIFDFGKNISGWGRIRVDAPPGTEIVLNYGERLGNDGKLDRKYIEQFVTSGEFQTDRYISKGGGTESWQPRFTYHGFQYIEATGLPPNSDVSSIRAVVVHTDLADAGSFECSNPLLNTIQDCARRSTLTNYHGFPTDCPHREKNGWTGDASLSAEQVLLNFDPITAYRKFLSDIVDAQRPNGQIPGIVPTSGWGYNWGSGPAWDSALILIPWYMYVYSADLQTLKAMYAAMVRYLGFLAAMTDQGIVDFGLGDWCPPADHQWEHKCPTVVTDTAYAYVDYMTVARIARLIGRDEDAGRFDSQATMIRSAFRASFVNSESGSVAGDSQTALACALYQDLLDDEEKPRAVERLVREIERNDNHLDTGILGTKYLLHTLSHYGRTDLAYTIATQTDYPSWGHWIAQGATTLWERWDGKESHNHHMYSDISAWFYRELAGLQPDPREPGFKHTIFRPNPVPGLTWAKAHHDSPYGRVESSWVADSDTVTLEVRVPTNCHGTISLAPEFSHRIRVNGSEPTQIATETSAGVARKMIRVGSGEYEVVATRAQG